jgi:peptidoglycan/LPS O-acetylase OafA/YrhL
MIGLRSWPVLRSASRFGDLSYGIYLWAWPMQQFVIVAMGKMAPFPTVLACSLASTVACAWLSWHLVERPALRLKPAKSEAWMPNRGHSLAVDCRSAHREASIHPLAHD